VQARGATRPGTAGALHKYVQARDARKEERVRLCTPVAFKGSSIVLGGCSADSLRSRDGSLQEDSIRATRGFCKRNCSPNRPLTQSSHSPLLPRESVTLASSPADHWRWCRRRLQAHSVALQNKASAMRRGVTQLAPRLMSVMRTEAGLLGRSMATVRAARRSSLELPTQGALRLLAAAAAQL